MDMKRIFFIIAACFIAIGSISAQSLEQRKICALKWTLQQAFYNKQEGQQISRISVTEYNSLADFQKNKLISDAIKKLQDKADQNRVSTIMTATAESDVNSCVPSGAKKEYQADVDRMKAVAPAVEPAAEDEETPDEEASAPAAEPAAPAAAGSAGGIPPSMPAVAGSTPGGGIPPIAAIMAGSIGAPPIAAGSMGIPPMAAGSPGGGIPPAIAGSIGAPPAAGSPGGGIPPGISMNALFLSDSARLRRSDLASSSFFQSNSAISVLLFGESEDGF